ncbi:MAG TPA: TIM-barrel domain-containing protein [Chitinophagaceae bacterium]|nr:TIM-barrel domain-containing protein [Chitinophagaceae bacterium]
MQGQVDLLNTPIDVSDDFYTLENDYYLAGAVTTFNAEKGEGTIEWNYHKWVPDWSFNKMGKHLKKTTETEVFWKEHDANPKLHFKISFISARTIRLQINTTAVIQIPQPSLMLDGEPPVCNIWQTADNNLTTVYTNSYGSVTINKTSFKLDIRDSDERLLTSTLGMEVLNALHHKTIPLMFTKRAGDYSRSVAASFTMQHDEKIYGCGESFTALNKRGQKLVLYSTDVQSTATKEMYKPVPFFISSRGHGMFLHTSTPVTFDFGHDYAGSKILYSGDDSLDLFLFIGTPKEILSAYTALTGRSPLPPLWSFGLWMSRFSYTSQQQVAEVAAKLRAHKIPCDVIHIDAGWFENGINCDYRFSQQTFPQPQEMIDSLKQHGLRISLWQIPYYTQHNNIFNDVVTEELCVKDANGNLYGEDAILDFSNPAAQQWYTQKIIPLLQMGVSAIKADFGEAAPYKGLYASDKTGFYEHNLYPLRYNQLLANITAQVTGEHIIWARSAWAGCQRYPVHWGGDPEVSDTGMAGTLRGGLSLGLSGFSFWSHDIGGFLSSPNEELFARWAVFGLFTSHSRVHGFPPREPWEFSDSFLQTFRRIVEMKYRLMPYIYTQAVIACENGWPLLKALLLNYPADETVWQIEDEYLFGDDILVAPLMEENCTKRKVYLPAGTWVDYQTKKIYAGGQWVMIKAGIVPGIILARYGTLIPHAALAQSTAFINWDEVELVAFSTGDITVNGYFYTKEEDEIIMLEAAYTGGEWTLSKNNSSQNFTIKAFNE